MRRTAAGVIALSLVACGQYVPPQEPAPRTGTTVDASFGKTWDATIDAFADRGISIETLDRASGLIVPAGRVLVREDTPTDVADCGRADRNTPAPYFVKYNVIVRGDSAHATIQVRAFYTAKPIELYGKEISIYPCVSKGVYETDAEAVIKARAEGRPAPINMTRRCSTSNTVRRDGDDFLATIFTPGNGTCTGAPCRLRGAALRMLPSDAILKCKEEQANAARSQ